MAWLLSAVSQHGQRAQVGSEHNRAQASLERLVAWLQQAPEITPDPNDFKALAWFARRLSDRNHFLYRLQLKGAYLFFGFFPRSMRRIVGVQVQQTAGAVSWMVQGHLALFWKTQLEKHLQAAESWLSRLDRMRATCNSPAWGLPFDWQSVILLPANCPLLYTTWQAAQAYYDHFCATGENHSLQTARLAMLGLEHTFRQTTRDRDQTGFSYSPHDSMQVFNTNSLAGGL
jgi:hypothetical protein